MEGFAVFRPGASYDKKLESLRCVQAAFMKTKARFRDQIGRVSQSTRIDFDVKAEMIQEMRTAWTGAVQFMKTIEAVCDMQEYELASRQDCTLEVTGSVSVAPDLAEVVNG
jgi:hypothetical protein